MIIGYYHIAIWIYSQFSFFITDLHYLDFLNYDFIFVRYSCVLPSCGQLFVESLHLQADHLFRTRDNASPLDTLHQTWLARVSISRTARVSPFSSPHHSILCPLHALSPEQRPAREHAQSDNHAVTDSFPMAAAHCLRLSFSHRERKLIDGPENYPVNKSGD